MVLRRWGLVGVAIAWIVGLAVASSLPAGPAHWPLTLTGLALIGSAGATTLLVFMRPRSLLAPIAPRLQFAIMGLWLVSALICGMARFAWSVAADPHRITNFALGTNLTVQGTVDAEPDERAKGAFLILDVTTAQLNGTGTWRQVSGRVSLFATGQASPFSPEYGDTIESQGVLATASPHSPPGVDADLTAARVQILARGGGNPILAAFFRLREALATAIEGALPAPEAALLIGILLGLKTPLLRSRLALFTTTGTIHLVVTSGLKVALVGNIVSTVTRSLGRFFALGLPLAAIAVYTILSGSGPAALRAAIMGSVLVLARYLGRDYDAPTALAAAAIAMTAIQPEVLWDVGFQLSAIGTLGIVVLGPRLTAPLGRLLRRVPAGATIAEVLATTAAAQIATFTLTAINFGIVSVVALFTNLLLVPLLPLFILMGALIGGLGLWSPALAGVMGSLCWPLLRLADIVIEQSAALPFAAITVGALPLWITPLWATLVGCVPLIWPIVPHAPSTPAMPAMPRVLRVALAITLLLALFAGVMLASVSAPQPVVRVTFLDVGPGGPATLLQLDNGRNVLIDGGADGPTLLTALTAQLPSWERTLDLVILTDVRPGHLTGLESVLTSYRVLAVVDPGALHPSTTYVAWYANLQAAHIPLATAHPRRVAPPQRDDQSHRAQSPSDVQRGQRRRRRQCAGFATRRARATHPLHWRCRRKRDRQYLRRRHHRQYRATLPTRGRNLRAPERPAIGALRSESADDRPCRLVTAIGKWRCIGASHAGSRGRRAGQHRSRWDHHAQYDEHRVVIGALRCTSPYYPAR